MSDDVFDFDFKRAGAFTLLDPDGVEVSQHTTIAYAQEAGIRHALKNRINGDYTIVAPNWSLRTMGFAITPTQGPDAIPANFSFGSQADVDLDQQVTSQEITPVGYNTSTSLSVINGQYSKNGGAFTSDAGVIGPGDTIRARHTSSTDYQDDVITTVLIGGVAGTFQTTTRQKLVLQPGPLSIEVGETVDMSVYMLSPRSGSQMTGIVGHVSYDPVTEIMTGVSPGSNSNLRLGVDP